jgi:peptidoglycan/LPS O-acetylase OafA/YrhL
LGAGLIVTGGAARNGALDGVRGWAALAVILFHSIVGMAPADTIRIFDSTIYGTHAPEWYVQKALLSVVSGEVAVIIFFVLSGCVLSKSLERMLSKEGVVTAAFDFVGKRVLRLYPPTIACVLAIAAVIYVLDKIRPLTFTTYPWLDVIANCLLVDYKVNGATWTLVIEAFMTLPLLLVGILTRYIGSLAQFLFLGAGVALLFGPPEYLAFLPLQHFTYFALGVFVPTLYGSAVAKTSNVYLSLLALIVTRCFVPVGTPYLVIAQATFAFVFVCCVFHQNQTNMVSFLNSAASQFLGKISFSLYLWNVMFLVVFWQVRAIFLPVVNYPFATGLVVGCAIAVISIPVAARSERFIEQRSTRLSRSWSAWLSSRNGFSGVVVGVANSGRHGGLQEPVLRVAEAKTRIPRKG